MNTNRPRLAALFAAASLLSLASPSYSQLYWDANGNTAGAGNTGGTWDAGTNWSTNAAGTVATQAWADGNQAIFSAGSDSPGTLAVTIAGTVAPSTVLVRQGTVNLSGGTLNSAGVITTLGGATLGLTGSTVASGNVFVLSNVATSNAQGAPFSAAATSTATLNITDNASLTLARLDIGNQTNGQGTVNLSGGTLTLTGNDGNGGLRLGHWGGVAGTRIFNHSAGTLNSTTSSGINIGWDGTGAQYNASGTAVVNASTIRIQRQSTLSIADAASITTTFLDIGTPRAAGNVQMSGGTLNVNGQTRIGHWGAGAGSTFTISGGTINATSGWYVGWDGANSTMTVDGGTLNLNFLGLRGNNAVLNINAGTIGATSLQLGEQPGRNTTVNQAGGSVTLSDRVMVGHWSNETSIYNMSGGALTLTNTSGNGGEQNGIITLGVDGTGIFNHSGGTVTAHGIHLDSRGATAGTDTYALTGGTLALGAYGIRGNADTSTFSVEFGGGWIRATANTLITVPATLTGTGGNVTFDSNGHTITASGPLSGTGGLTKTGAGTLTLTAANSYSGGAVINAGILRQTGYNGSTGAGAGNLDFTINNGGRLQLDSGYFAGNPFGSQTIDILVNTGGTFEIVSPHALGGSNLNGGSWRTVTLDGGTLTLTREQYITGGTLNGNGRLVMTGGLIDGPNELRATSQPGGAILTVLPNATPSTMAARLATSFGNWSLDVRNGAQLNVTGTIVGGNGVTVTGGGTTRFTNTNTYTGGTTVNAGVLELALPANTAEGAVRGTLTVNPGATVITSTTNSLGWGGGTRVTTLNLNGGTLDNTATGDQGWGITINLTGGTLQSNGGISSPTTNSYFSLGGGSAINSLASPNTSTIAGRIHLREGNAGNVLPFNVADGAAAIDLDVTAAITQSAAGRGITKSGAGTMQLTGSNTYSGTTTVSAGTLLVNNASGSATGTGAVIVSGTGATLGGAGRIAPGANGLSILSGGILSPGNSPDALTVAGNVLFGPGSFFDLDLAIGGVAGLGDGTSGTDRLIVQNGLVNITGGELTGTWGGNASNIFDGTADASNMLWTITGANALSGTFANTAEAPGYTALFGTTPHLTSIDGQTFAVFYGANLGSLSLTGGNDLLIIAVPEPSRALFLALAPAIFLLRRRRPAARA